MARTAIQSDYKHSKLCYAGRGPYQIFRNTGHGSYFVKKLNRPDSPEQKFIAYDLYSLPLSLKRCEPVDAIDTRYLNQSHEPLTNILKKTLHIELYNEKWFNKPLPTSIPPFNYQRDTIKILTAFLPPFQSVIELHEETHTYSLQSLFEKEDDTCSNNLSPLALHKSLATTD